MHDIKLGRAELFALAFFAVVALLSALEDYGQVVDSLATEACHLSANTITTIHCVGKVAAEELYALNGVAQTVFYLAYVAVVVATVPRLNRVQWFLPGWFTLLLLHSSGTIARLIIEIIEDQIKDATRLDFINPGYELIYDYERGSFRITVWLLNLIEYSSQWVMLPYVGAFVWDYVWPGSRWILWDPTPIAWMLAFCSRLIIEIWSWKSALRLELLQNKGINLPGTYPQPETEEPIPSPESELEPLIVKLKEAENPMTQEVVSGNPNKVDDTPKCTPELKPATSRENEFQMLLHTVLQDIGSFRTEVATRECGLERLLNVALQDIANLRTEMALMRKGCDILRENYDIHMAETREFQPIVNPPVTKGLSKTERLRRQFALQKTMTALTTSPITRPRPLTPTREDSPLPPKPLSRSFTISPIESVDIEPLHQEPKPEREAECPVTLESPEVESPEMKPPESKSPEVESSGVASPEMTSPEVASPEMKYPEVKFPPPPARVVTSESPTVRCVETIEEVDAQVRSEQAASIHNENENGNRDEEAEKGTKNENGQNDKKEDEKNAERDDDKEEEVGKEGYKEAGKEDAVTEEDINSWQANAMLEDDLADMVIPEEVEGAPDMDDSDAVLAWLLESVDPAVAAPATVSKIQPVAQPESCPDQVQDIQMVDEEPEPEPLPAPPTSQADSSDDMEIYEPTPPCSPRIEKSAPIANDNELDMQDAPTPGPSMQDHVPPNEMEVNMPELPIKLPDLPAPIDVPDLPTEFPNLLELLGLPDPDQPSQVPFKLPDLPRQVLLEPLDVELPEISTVRTEEDTAIDEKMADGTPLATANLQSPRPQPALAKEPLSPATVVAAFLKIRCRLESAELFERGPKGSRLRRRRYGDGLRAVKAEFSRENDIARPASPAPTTSAPKDSAPKDAVPAPKDAVPVPKPTTGRSPRPPPTPPLPRLPPLASTPSTTAPSTLGCQSPTRPQSPDPAPPLQTPEGKETTSGRADSPSTVAPTPAGSKKKIIRRPRTGPIFMSRADIQKRECRLGSVRVEALKRENSLSSMPKPSPARAPALEPVTPAPKRVAEETAEGSPSPMGGSPVPISSQSPPPTLPSPPSSQPAPTSSPSLSPPASGQPPPSSLPSPPSPPSPPTSDNSQGCPSGEASESSSESSSASSSATSQFSEKQPDPPATSSPASTRVFKFTATRPMAKGRRTRATAEQREMAQKEIEAQQARQKEYEEAQRKLLTKGKVARNEPKKSQGPEKRTKDQVSQEEDTIMGDDEVERGVRDLTRTLFYKVVPGEYSDETQEKAVDRAAYVWRRFAMEWDMVSNPARKHFNTAAISWMDDMMEELCRAGIFYEEDCASVLKEWRKAANLQPRVR